MGERQKRGRAIAAQERIEQRARIGRGRRRAGEFERVHRDVAVQIEVFGAHRCGTPSEAV